MQVYSCLRLELLSLIGEKIIPPRRPSLGLAAKLCNNYLSGLTAITGAEALNMGMRAGLGPRVLSKVFAGTAQNAICDRFNPCPALFRMLPQAKDMRAGSMSS